MRGMMNAFFKASIIMSIKDVMRMGKTFAGLSSFSISIMKRKGFKSNKISTNCIYMDVRIINSSKSLTLGTVMLQAPLISFPSIS